MMTPQTPRRVMLVDDEPDHVTLWRRVLELAGHAVVTFTDPVAALAALAEQPCDCVITDYHMPIMSGAELIRRGVRAGGPAFIVLTGNASPQVAQEAMQAGATCVFAKPVRIETLTTAVEWACRRGAHERASNTSDHLTARAS